MLRVKKILEEILPKTREVSPEQMEAYRKAECDGAIIYEEYSSKDCLYCLNCGTVYSAQDAGGTACPTCHNNVIRGSRARNSSDLVYRSIEKIDGFIVIKDSTLAYRESMDSGSHVSLTYEECIVVQKKDIGCFYNRPVYENYQLIGYEWGRVKSFSNRYRASIHTKCMEFDEEALKDDLFDAVRPTIRTLGLHKMAELLLGTTRTEKSSDVVCPEFDESLISYRQDGLATRHELYEREEELEFGTPLVRYHLWCTQCGKYSTAIQAKRSYLSRECLHCRGKAGHLTSSGLNYFLTPQEGDDGTMLLRIDEGYHTAYTDDPLKVGEDLNVKYRLEIGETSYVYITLDGKAHLFDKKGKPKEKLDIKTNRYDRTTLKFTCTEEHREVILNNTAVKRTGFVEYFTACETFDLHYFNAMQISPYTEMFSKMGLVSLVLDLMYETDSKKIPAYIRHPDDKSPIKKLTKPQLKELIKHDCGLEQFVQYIQVFKKDSTTMYSDFHYIARQSHLRHILDVLRVGVPGMTVKKMREYIDRVDEAQCCSPGESAQLWADYLRMLKQLECDLTDSSLIYPNSLKREHDKAARKVTQVADEKLAAQFRKRAEENEWCSWANDSFKVLIPHEITELYEEGRKLHHCVGTYGKAVVSGNCTIAFIRRVEEADMPFCTVEIRNKRIVQARGISNRPATGIPKVKGFMEKWAKEKGLTLDVA